MRTYAKRPFRDRRGTTAVEFALVAPVIFIFVIGVLELWRVNMFRHSAAQAAYQATRAGVVPGATAASIQQVAQTVMASVGARNVQVNVNPAVVDRDTPQITVTVLVPISSNGWILPRFFQAPNISAFSTLRRESAEL